MDGIPSSIRHPASTTPGHRLLASVVLTVCLLLILHACFLEPFQVPTGSMAPVLLGHHRSGVCPRCGFVVDVGRTRLDNDGSGGERCYEGAQCPNCGCRDLQLGQVPETSGDHVLANSSIYGLRRPRRWEVVVFRLFGKTFIKRLIALDGEVIEIVDGDIYIDGRLERKSFDEFLGMRVLVFDNDFAPRPDGWKDRWEYQPDGACSATPVLTLDGRTTPHQLTYRHFSLDERKCQPLTNEYAYNARHQRDVESVHDFMVEADVEVVEGKGTLRVALADGGMEVETELAVGTPRQAVVRAQGTAFTGRCALKNSTKLLLAAGSRYHMEMALVDRRLTVRVDGRDVFAPLDFAPATEREAVVRPLRLGADGVLFCLHHIRLYRDVHYTQVGKNAVRGRPVRLGIDQTFVLGDNSSNSEDSRFWPHQGAVPVDCLAGRAFLVHLPSQAVTWDAWGRHWRYQLPAWDRVRVLR